jgi:hypothetical protein
MYEIAITPGLIFDAIWVFRDAVVAVHCTVVAI